MKPWENADSMEQISNRAVYGYVVNNSGVSLPVVFTCGVLPSVKRAEASVPLLVFRYPDADQISWLLHSQDKMVLVKIEDSILFHFSKLQRQAAALNAEIIRELLP